MAVFLNREGILKHFDRLFEKAKKEIIMVVPFIQLSKDTLEKFKLAHSNKIEIVIVYRENKLNTQEREKLLQFDNITLMHHPNVHAKCYLNEESIIVCSMNLYEHSMKNNREMGVLLAFFDEEADPNSFSYTTSDGRAIKETLAEVRTIIQASTIDKKSNYFSNTEFKLEILKTKTDYLREIDARINCWSDNKTFEVILDSDNHPIICCNNYYENLDVIIAIDTFMSRSAGLCFNLRRVEMFLNHPEDQQIEIKLEFDSKGLEYRYKYFKTYFPKTNAIMLYRDGKQYAEIWDNATEEQLVRGFLKGCGKVIQDLKKIKSFQKIK